MYLSGDTRPNTCFLVLYAPKRNRNFPADNMLRRYLIFNMHFGFLGVSRISLVGVLPKLFQPFPSQYSSCNLLQKHDKLGIVQ